MIRNWIKKAAIVALAGGMSVGVMACGDDDANGDSANQQNQGDMGIEVAGTWETNFGDEELIDEEVWGFRDLIDYDNEDRQAVTQNPEDAEFGALEYSRIEWTPLEGDVFYYCETVFGLETEDEAWQEEGVADADDLEGGCGEDGFGWTQMERL